MNVKLKRESRLLIMAITSVAVVVHIVVICAGANQKEGQTRLELTKINTNIVKDIALKIKSF